MRFALLLLPVFLLLQGRGYEHRVTFAAIPSDDDKQVIEHIILKRLEMLGVENADFAWDGGSLSYKTDPYKDPDLLDKYVNIRGEITFSSVDGLDEEEELYVINNDIENIVALDGLDIELLSMESRDYHEPNYAEITLKFNRPVERPFIVCLIDGMKALVCNAKSGDIGAAVAKNPFEKLLKICLESGQLPVDVRSNLSRKDYESSKGIWFPVSSELRKKLYEERSKFELSQLDFFPRLSEYLNPEGRGIIQFAEGNGFTAMLELQERKVRVVAVKGIVNMDSGFIEVAVSNGGKLHESLLFTPVDMKSLDLAITAIGIEKDGYRSAGNVYVQWEVESKLYTYKLEDLIIDIVNFKTMERLPWKYQYKTVQWHDPITNEYYDIPKFTHSGLVITTLRNDGSLFDNPAPDKDAIDDSRYVVNSFLAPPVGQKIFIVFIAPEQDDK